MKPFSEMGDAELAAALRTLRPEPSPAFAAELDQRAAAGFPRRSPQGARNPFARFLAWPRGGMSWRLLIPVGGFAVFAIAIATVVVVGSNSSGGGADSEVATSATAGEVAATESAGGGGSADLAPLREQAAPSAGAAE